MAGRKNPHPAAGPPIKFERGTMRPNYVTVRIPWEVAKNTTQWGVSGLPPGDKVKLETVIMRSYRYERDNANTDS